MPEETKPADPPKVEDRLAKVEAANEVLLKGNSDLRQMVGDLLKSVKITPPEPVVVKPADAPPEPKSVADLNKAMADQRALHESQLKLVQERMDAKEKALIEKDRLAAITAVAKAPGITKIGQELLDGVLRSKVEMVDGRAVIRNSRELAPGVKHDEFVPMEAFVEGYLKERPEIVKVADEPAIVPSKGGVRGSEPAVRLADLPSDYEAIKANKELFHKALVDHPEHMARLQAAYIAKSREAARANWNSGQPGRITK